MIEEKEVKLILEDGKEFQGISFGYEKSVSGEVVFNTAMTG
jgi:carbamoylphosphate synthase small subunit